MNFLWGVATSAYQIEGGEESDWADWEAAGRLRANHESCGEATGHSRLWRADLSLLPGIGANAYRFSIEWSRVCPRPGEYREDVLADYRRRVEFLRSAGVEPVLTLFHYTHPRWFWDFGWESRAGVEAFLGFARRVADAVGDLVAVYTILNEPIVFVLGGYVDGSIPPGRKDFRLGARALENMLHAHVEAAEILRARNPNARFGIAHNMMDFAPERADAPADRRLAQLADRFYNRCLLEALATEEVDFRMPWIGSAKFRVAGLSPTADFVGVNYYSRLHLRFPGRERLAGDFAYRDRQGRGLTQTGWEIHPEGLARCLRIAAETGKPVIVTENGVATTREHLRRDFLREHALMLAHARNAGLNIRGYFYWSLLDNFEWLEGFGPRFGLFEVDYATLARRRRPAADLFAELGRGFLQTEFTNS